MKAVILAGGLGTRLSEETQLRPKPMVEIGGRPILWHILKIYSHFGINDFVICAGYKGYMIKEYFANYWLHMSDVTFNMKTNGVEIHDQRAEPWRVTIVDTGEHANTGGRLKRVRHYLDGGPFCFTYGDGVADIDIEQLIRFHQEKKVDATLTSVRPPGRYGALELSRPGHVAKFHEKPMGDGGRINGGFFVLNPSVIELIEGDDSSWEQSVLPQIAEAGQLSAFDHDGFWRPMDTLRDKMYLEELWATDQAPLETLDVSNFWVDRRVLVTGHTGFKGAWLTLWLRLHGARVCGAALEPEQPHSLLKQFVLTDDIDHHIIDVRDSDLLRQLVVQTQPEIIFHMAAQALVRRSYQEPVDTWNINVNGTINLLESLRHLDSPFVAVIVTSDKVYLNREWEHAYRESDALGGHDPYSSSKAAVEIAVASWRRSFFLNPLVAAIATGRAGNVIGGGDWAEDRIVPDIIRSFTGGEELGIRNPAATRPWQHVLEPLAGYLRLAEQLKIAQQGGNSEELSELCSAWNFGPLPESNRTVQQLVEMATEFWPGRWSERSQPDGPHEARFLGLSIDRACRSLNWYPRWNFRGVNSPNNRLVSTRAWWRDSTSSFRRANSSLRVRIRELDLPGVFRIDLDRIKDERGFFARMFCQKELAEHGLMTRIVQCNNTLTRNSGTIRGMHFQTPPKAETKIVRCIRGAVFDVAVDLRAGSETFGQWCSMELNDEGRSMIYIPQGFAHGFQTLTRHAELLYLHSEFYSKSDEGGLDPLDPAVAIAWPLPVKDMSARDRRHPLLCQLRAIEL